MCEPRTALTAQQLECVWKREDLCCVFPIRRLSPCLGWANLYSDDVEWEWFWSNRHIRSWKSVSGDTHLCVHQHNRDQVFPSNRDVIEENCSFTSRFAIHHPAWRRIHATFSPVVAVIDGIDSNRYLGSCSSPHRYQLLFLSLRYRSTKVNSETSVNDIHSYRIGYRGRLREKSADWSHPEKGRKVLSSPVREREWKHVRNSPQRSRVCVRLCRRFIFTSLSSSKLEKQREKFFFVRWKTFDLNVLVR